MRAQTMQHQSVKRSIVIAALVIASAQASALSPVAAQKVVQRVQPVAVQVRISPVAVPIPSTLRLLIPSLPKGFKGSGATPMDGGYPGGLCPKC